MPALPWVSKSTLSDTDTGLIRQLKLTVDVVPLHILILSAFAVGSVSTLTTSFIYARYLRRIKTGDWVTPDIFARKRWIKGVVTNVGDADNFRLYHTPGLGWKWPLKYRRVPSGNKDLKAQTLHIRIAGVDAPEAAHFGRPSQPYAAESLAWLKGQISGKTVYCQLLHRDQYARIVANVILSPRFLPGAFVWGKSLQLDMLWYGWATTYEQAGAEYGKWGKEEFLRIEAAAKAARRGMWKEGINGETPAEFKRRHAQSADDVQLGSATNTNLKKQNTALRRWLRALWF